MKRSRYLEANIILSQCCNVVFTEVASWVLLRAVCLLLFIFLREKYIQFFSPNHPSEDCRADWVLVLSQTTILVNWELESLSPDSLPYVLLMKERLGRLT